MEYRYWSCRCLNDIKICMNLCRYPLDKYGDLTANKPTTLRKSEIGETVEILACEVRRKQTQSLLQRLICVSVTAFVSAKDDYRFNFPREQHNFIRTCMWILEARRSSLVDILIVRPLHNCFNPTHMCIYTYCCINIYISKFYRSWDSPSSIRLHTIHTHCHTYVCNVCTIHTYGISV